MFITMSSYKGQREYYMIEHIGIHSSVAYESFERGNALDSCAIAIPLTIQSPCLRGLRGLRCPHILAH